MVDIKPGQAFVAGVSAKVARGLLDAAAKAGLDPKTAVRTTDGGFVVPEQIAPSPSKSPSKPASKPASKGKTARILPVDPPPEPDPSPAPRRRRKKTEKES